MKNISCVIRSEILYKRIFTFFFFYLIYDLFTHKNLIHILYYRLFGKSQIWTNSVINKGTYSELPELLPPSEKQIDLW